MLGEDTSWVRNVRAAGGRSVLCHGGRGPIRLQEVDVDHRAAILRCYLTADGAVGLVTSGLADSPDRSAIPVTCWPGRMTSGCCSGCGG